MHLTQTYVMFLKQALLLLQAFFVHYLSRLMFAASLLLIIQIIKLKELFFVFELNLIKEFIVLLFATIS